jgi:predicted ATPase
MPALLELLYREYCRARLAEMRKQLLLTGKHAGHLQADHDSADADADADGVDRADTQAEFELTRARK